MTYEQFLNSKIKLAEKKGFEFPDEALHPILKPHQRDIAAWAIRGGCRAVFASFGLGKSLIQIEILKMICIRMDKPVLIVSPLGVKHEFIRDAKKVKIDIKYITSTDQMDDHKFYITNYERIRMGSIDPEKFAGVSFDEASILRSLETDTTEAIMKTFMAVPFRFVCTATPSPNRFLELINYAEYLGIMDRGQSLTRFFQRDSTTAGNLTLYEKRKKEFWYWMSSWACFITKPSDLGYDNAGYDLPEIIIHRHMVQYDRDDIVDKKTSQMTFVPNASKSLVDAAKEKRESLEHRIEKMMEIINANPDDNFIIWHHLESERHAIDKVLPKAIYNHWLEFKDGHPDALEIYERHYSAREYQDGRERKLFAGPGEKCVLLTPDRSALFVWRKFIDDSGQQGINCAVFRNEGSTQSSELILEAMQIAWLRWPGERLYTYVNSEKIESVNPGYCFKWAGWRKCGETKGGLVILESVYDGQALTVERKKGLCSVYGSQDLDEREEFMIGFSEGKYKYMSTKPEICGSGVNWQYHCHKVIYLGIDYKFNDFIQSLHRVYRFLQEHQVEAHIIYTDAEDDILKTLEVKWSNHLTLQNEMTAIIQEQGLNSDLFKEQLGREMFTGRKEFKSENYLAVNNDCVEEVKAIADNSVHLICTSIPFGNHYEYSENYNCFGHNESNEEFFEQMDFLIPDLYRALSPGRIAAIHVKDRIRYSYMNGTGFTSIDPFSDDTTRAFRKHGFHLLTRITVTTDVVQENNQTYRLGWSEKCKDGSKMGAGLPEYVLIFRKPPSSSDNAYADIPVEHNKKEYTRARWQLDAHAFWKSAGERLMNLDELRKLDLSTVLELWKAFEASNTYDYRKHIQICELLDSIGKLPSTFMTLPPQSDNPDVWDDITRMNTLNSDQSRRNLTKHICPLQLDIIERLIESYTNKGETVLDPFAGIMSVPYQALKMDRKALGIELNTSYWFDGLRYLRNVDIEKAQLTLI